MASGLNGTIDYAPVGTDRSDGKGVAHVSRSGHNDLLAMFSTSPVSSGDALASSKEAFYNARFVLNSDNAQMGTFDPNYGNAPTMSDVPEGAASAFCPNPSSPTDGAKWDTKPDAPDGYGTIPTHDVTADGSDTASITSGGTPADTAAKIKATAGVGDGLGPYDSGRLHGA
jgi:hypothetical protein